MLVDKNEYLAAGIHIGMKMCTSSMKKFVYKVREDGLCVFNLQEVDERIAKAANLLSKYKNILVVSHKDVSLEPVKKFAELVEGNSVHKRFSPGTLTNPSYREFCEPDIVMVVDPLIDKQAIEEAKKRRVPIIGLCGTMNEPVDIDLIVPINNNSRKAMALFFLILSRELLKARGKIKSDEEFKETLKDFGDTGKEKRKSGEGVSLGGNMDVDIDIEIERVDRKKKPSAKKDKKRPSSNKSKQEKL